MFHHTFFSNELSFSILFSFDSLFGERKKGGIRENLFQGLKCIRRSFERVEKKKKKRNDIRNVPLLSDDYRLPSFGRWRVISLKRIITDLKKIIVRQFSLTVDPNLRKAIFYSRQFYKNLSYFTFYSKYERKLQLDRRNVWSELREKN